MSTYKKWIFLAVLCGIVVAVLMFMTLLFILDYSQDPSDIYEKYAKQEEYTEELNVKAILCSYSEFRETWPDPLEHIPVGDDYYFDGFYAVYDGIQFMFLDDGETGIQDEYRLFGAIIEDDDCSFGRLKIGLGTKRWKVRLAYLLNYRYPYEYNGYSFGYMDGVGLDLWFRFDENNRVDRILVRKGEF